jgi:hypothetical protein
MKAVQLTITRDDSDGMSDYYHPYATVTAFWLGFVGRRERETEALARLYANQVPELKALNLEWHTEKYSGGHGNFLVSEFVPDLATRNEGGKEVSCPGRYVVEFGSYGEYPKHEHFSEGLPKSIGSTPGEEVGTVTMRLNNEKNGVELRFPGRPADEILETLKAHGFRWSKFQRLWYARQSPGTLALATQLASAEKEPDKPLMAQLIANELN